MIGVVARQSATELARERMHVVIVGHVDHGKSTLVGRLLADTHSLPQLKIESVRAYCDKNARPFEYAFLVDSLKDERAQGITIDSARVFFKSARRDYLLIDAPGHSEFLKNMITGVARASAAILVIDAEEGLRENSRRHAYLLSMLSIRQIAVLVNKMDRVGYCHQKFEELVKQTTEFLSSIKIYPRHFIPVSGIQGDQIVEKSENMSWFSGPTVLEALDAFNAPEQLQDHPFRLPVQDVYKFTAQGDTRRLVVGTIEAGRIRVGDELIFYPSGKKSRVRSIEGFNRPILQEALSGEATALTLVDEIYVGRGEIAVRSGERPTLEGNYLEGSLFWLGRESLKLKKKYVLKLGTASVEGHVEEIDQVIDIATLNSSDEISRNASKKTEIFMNEFANCKIRLQRPLAFDEASPFVLVDDHRIAGGGLVISNIDDFESKWSPYVKERNSRWISGTLTASVRAERHQQKPILLVITGQAQVGRKQMAAELERQLFTDGRLVYWMGMGNVIRGLNVDIDRTDENRSEHFRRLAELTHVLLDIGAIVILTAQEINAREMKILGSMNPDGLIYSVWVGDSITTDIQPHLQFSPVKNDTHALRKAVKKIKARFSELGVLRKLIP